VRTPAKTAVAEGCPTIIHRYQNLVGNIFFRPINCTVARRPRCAGAPQDLINHVPIVCRLSGTSYRPSGTDRPDVLLGGRPAASLIQRAPCGVGCDWTPLRRDDVNNRHPSVATTCARGLASSKPWKVSSTKGLAPRFVRCAVNTQASRRQSRVSTRYSPSPRN
jgi:hypothetical protein